MIITYRALTTADLEGVRQLYRAEGWTAYLHDDARLARAWGNSLYACGAFDGETLIGFIRCIGDGEHTVLIQDLLVRREYRRLAIGRTLTKAVLERYRQVRQLFVVTDADTPAVAFYRAIGLQPFSEGGLLALYRGDLRA